MPETENICSKPSVVWMLCSPRTTFIMLLLRGHRTRRGNSNQIFWLFFWCHMTDSPFSFVSLPTGIHESSEAAVTHGLQQWAADTTHWRWMSVPPQKWWPMNRREAWWLMALGFTTMPPMIRFPNTAGSQWGGFVNNSKTFISNKQDNFCSPVRFIIRRRWSKGWNNGVNFILAATKNTQRNNSVTNPWIQMGLMGCIN